MHVLTCARPVHLHAQSKVERATVDVDNIRTEDITFRAAIPGASCERTSRLWVRRLERHFEHSAVRWKARDGKWKARKLRNPARRLDKRTQCSLEPPYSA